jgi:predicted transcriptional regulator
MARGGNPNSSQPARIGPGQRWIMSIKSKYTGRIYSGDKRYEFRKRRMNVQVGDEIVIYESWPTKLVTGSFIAGPLSRFGITRDEALMLEHPGKAREDLARYLGDAQVITALEITELRKTEPQGLHEATGLDKGPVSYQRLG